MISTLDTCPYHVYVVDSICLRMTCTLKGSRQLNPSTHAATPAASMGSCQTMPPFAAAVPTSSHWKLPRGRGDLSSSLLLRNGFETAWGGASHFMRGKANQSR